jgi:hypothetical protein
MMMTLSYSLRGIYGCVCLLVCTWSSLFGAEVILHKAPNDTAATKRADSLGPQANFALVNYSVKQTHPKARALYVSSGANLAQANSMVDDQPATSFGFSTDDKFPTTLIDLGRVCTLRRLSTVYSARPGSFDFYVMQSLPATVRDDLTGTMKFNADAFANVKPIASTIDDGTKGRAAIEFPATRCRYVMLRWIPAEHENRSFTVAEIRAVGSGGGPLLASSGRFMGAEPEPEETVTVDAKDVVDAKDIYESKDIAEAPAEGPAPWLPQPPPFSFIPFVVPVSP